MLRIASDFTQLALHALAHLPIEGPARLMDRGYLEWTTTNLPEGARTPIARDAQVLASLCARTPTAASLLQAAPELFADIAQLRASAARDLAELGDAEVADPRLLAAYRASDATLVELWRAAVALAAPPFAAEWHGGLRARCAEGLEAVRGPLAEARRLHPALSEALIELAWPLGPRGRAFARRILVGVPGDWGELAAEIPAVVAMHEAAVRAAGEPLRRVDREERYVRAEWASLVDVADRMTQASAALRDAHATWLGSLDLEPLCRSAAELGLVAPAAAEAVAERRGERAETLVGCR
jgi:hypothetical protein